MSDQVFERRLPLPVSTAEAFAWHERPGALQRLLPPWESADVVERIANIRVRSNRNATIRDGSIVRLVTRLGPLKLTWVAEHHDYRAGESFRDTQRSGPFAKWEHLHSFETDSDGNAALVDHIEYRIPGGRIGALFGGKFVRHKIDRIFEYRHSTTRDDLALHAKHVHSKQRRLGPMKLAITGASGLVGSELTPLLTTGGHTVIRLVRREANAGEVTWNPKAATFDATPLEGVDGIVHLAGENIGESRWTASAKQKFYDSRVVGTRKLCEGLARMTSPPKVLVCASAIGFYSERGDEVMTEESPVGTGFLANLVNDWEAATAPAKQAGIRVVNLRIGVVMSPQGGALAKMLLPFKLCAGGRVGDGKQYWSWISIDDAAGAIYHAITTDELSGPVNAVAPNPVTNAEFTKTLGRVLRRPTIVPIPAFAARLALGEMAEELMLASTRVEPVQLRESGYEFRQPTLEKSLRHLLGRTL